MIDGRTITNGDAIEADLCIIGGGPIGLSLAYSLLGTGIKIVLLETGGEKQSNATDELSGGFVNGDRYAPLSMYRRRMLGGSSSIWGGRCVPYDEIDFEERDYVRHSGWPFTKSTLAPYYAQATSLSDAGTAEYDATSVIPHTSELLPGLKSETLLTSSMERFSLPTNFWKKLGPALISADRITIVTNATCVSLDVGGQSGRIYSAKFCTINENKFEVRAKYFVISAGGIETYRLLASSNGFYKNGIGNEHGVLGRYFMSHIEGCVSELHLSDKTASAHWGFDIIEEIYCRRRISLSQDVQRNEKLLNMIMRLHYRTAADPRHEEAILSLMFLAKRFILAEYGRKISMVDRSAIEALPKGFSFWWNHVVNIVAGSPHLAAFLVDWIRRRNLAHRKIPYVVLPGKGNVFPLDFNSEQVPNPESRIYLSTQADRFGVPLAVIDWRMTETDILSIASTMRLVKRELERCGVGTLFFGSGSLEDRIASDAVPIGGHHIGATRMHKDPKYGVVNQDLRVHGVENLFVASTAVLPTSSHANPTLTVIALTLRLADKLLQYSKN